MENKIPVNINAIDFADSEILSYTVKRGCLILFIERWNAEILEIKFLDYAASFDMGYFRIAEMQEVFETPFLERVLKEYYEIKPKEHNVRVFKFFNSDDMTALEIICKDVNIRIIKKMVF